jgi:hypothetical protein
MSTPIRERTPLLCRFTEQTQRDEITTFVLGGPILLEWVAIGVIDSAGAV